MSEIKGVWFVYGTDWNAYPIAVCDNELDARRIAMSNYGQVTFWPFNVEWSDHGTAATPSEPTS